MFGILDRLYERKKRGTLPEQKSVRPIVEYKGNAQESWYCFVPKTVFNNEGMNKGIIPQNGKVSVYVISYSDLIVPDVKATLENLRSVYTDAMIRMTKILIYQEV